MRKNVRRTAAATLAAIALGAGPACRETPCRSGEPGCDPLGAALLYQQNGCISYDALTFLGSTSADMIRGLKPLGDNGVLVALTTSDAIVSGNASAAGAYSALSDLVVARYRENGELRWISYLGSAADDLPVGSAGHVSMLEYGDALLIAAQAEGAFGNPDIPYNGNGTEPQTFLALLDPNTGAIQQLRFLQTGTAANRPAGLLPLNDGGFVLVVGTNTALAAGAGAASNAPFGLGDMALVRYDANFQPLGHTYIGGASLELPFSQSLRALPDGDALFTFLSAGTLDGSFGTPVRASSGGTDTIVMRLNLDSGLTIRWHTFIGAATGTDIGFSAFGLSDGSILNAGAAASSFGSVVRPHSLTDGTNADAFAARITATGALDWTSYLGTSGNTGDEAFADGRPLDDGGALLVGGAAGAVGATGRTGGGGPYDALLARVTSGGALESVDYFGGTGEDTVLYIEPACDGGYWLAGFAQDQFGANVLQSHTGGSLQRDVWLMRIRADRDPGRVLDP